MARKKKEVEVVTENLLIEIPEPKRIEVAPVVEAHKENNSTVKVLSVSNVRHDRDGTFLMDVLFEHIGVVVPFLAAAHDDQDYGRDLHARAAAGEFGDIGEYDRPMPTVADLQAELDKLWPDVVLGLASDEELELAKLLRKQIKVMS